MNPATKTPQGARATDREVKGLDSDFQNRLLQAVHDTESSLQSQAAQHLDSALAVMRAKLEEQFKTKLEEISAGWEAERTRLNNEVTRLTQAGAQWEKERARLTTEVERLARVQAATQAEAEKALAAAKAATQSVSKSATPLADTEELTAEMERVQGLIKEISDLIEDPATELSTVIRKNVERAELESYLKGIRFALNGSATK